MEIARNYYPVALGRKQWNPLYILDFLSELAAQGYDLVLI